MTFVNATSSRLPKFRTMGGEVAALHDGTTSGIDHAHGQYTSWLQWANKTIEVYKGRSLLEATIAFNAATATANALTADLIVHYSDVRLVMADTAFHAGSHLDDAQGESIGAVDIFSDKDSFRAVTEADERMAARGAVFSPEQFQTFLDDLTRRPEYKDAQEALAAQQGIEAAADALQRAVNQDAHAAGSVPPA
jgi:hypothetical protein